jgi:PAS domain S-box-containing protein
VKRKRQDEVLKEKYNVLKMLIQERTNELAEANAALTKEIKQREQVEATLLDSEQRSHEQVVELELLYRTAPLGLCHMDRDLRYLRCNEKLAEINGIPPKDHMGRTLREIVPEIAETMESVYHHVIESGNPVVDVVASGATAADPQKVRYFSACYYPVKSEDGVVQGVSSIVQDITERKEAEENLREAHNQLERRVEERTKDLAVTNLKLTDEIIERKRTENALKGSEESLRVLLETTNAIPWEADAKTWQFTYVGPKATELLGYSPEQWHEKDFWASHIHPEDREFAIRTCLESSAKCKDFEFEYRMVSSEGKTVWVHDIASVETLDGAPQTLRGFMVDITERKKAEESLRENEERTRLIVDSALDAVVTMDTRGLITGWNPQAETIFGWPSEDVIGRRMDEFIIPLRYREAHRRGLEHFLASNNAPMLNKRIELTALHRDGHEFPVELAIVPIRTGESFSFSAFVRDITERKRAENTLQDLRARMINAQEEARRRLARELHDDVSQRLAVLAIEAGKLEQQSNYTPELIHGKLQGMRDQIVKLAGDIHRISRQLHPSILDDLGLVDAMESECRRFSELEGIPVKFTGDRFPEGTPKDVSLCLYRVAQESLRNIAKHSKATGARVTLTGKNGRVFLSVEDSGVGFEPAKTQGKLGLGLASMEERVKLINGSLSIHSEPGKGTVIEIQGPLASTDRV